MPPVIPKVPAASAVNVPALPPTTKAPLSVILAVVKLPPVEDSATVLKLFAVLFKVALIAAASEMLIFVDQFNETSSTNWQIRIGIASGSCVAGIVGTKKYQFDLFGDTVNTAARMEAYSSPGLINIDQRSFDLAKNEPGLLFKPRPVTHVKGKGDQQMYFVEPAGP